MATFTAYQAADFTNLDIYKNIRSSIFIPDAANGGAGGFKAQFALTSWVQIKGFGFVYATTPFGTVPYLGTTTATSTYIDGKLAFTVTGLSITQEQAGQYITMPASEVRDIVFGGADTLIGSTFNDTLDGFGGGDTMKGGAGNDTYFVDSSADTVIEIVGGGRLDTVKARVSYTLQAKQEIEALSAADAKGTAKLVLTGNEFRNTITGNAGDNRIDGKAGADVMNGLAGSDTYRVDNALDQVIESVKDRGTDSVITTVSYKLAAGQSIENLSADVSTRLTNNAKIDLTGNEFANTIKGNAAANVINGGGASKAGAGADILFGLSGKDTFVFDSAILNAKGAVIAGNDAHLADFKVIDDTIQLAKSVFAGLTADAKGVLVAEQFKDIGKLGAKVDANDRVLYDSKSGALYYDKDGLGGSAAIKFATIDTFKTQVDTKGVSTVSHLDFLIG
ncbi:calcium-binding protein [Methylorubrum sp. SB2]|uniref:calcium-binding protein n=1 Tax=Methylorubrum subtropicum TaxID=3138812 RepID=UPI00313BC6E7